MGDKCCKVGKQGATCEVEDKLFETSEFIPFDPSQEPIFPPELKLNDAYDKETLMFINDRGIHWYRPSTLQQMLQFRKDHPEAKIINGNTEVGVEVKIKKLDYSYFVNPAQLDELLKIEATNDGIKIGSAVTLTELQEVLIHQINNLPENETRLCRAIVDMLHWFAGKQIRNVASIAGNIMTGSPISDLNPIFQAAAIE